MTKKIKTSAVENISETFILDVEIEQIAKNLYYISETDAEILPFVGTAAAEVTEAEILKQTGSSTKAKIERRAFNDFFERLTKVQDWFGDEEKANAARFAALKALLADNLRDITVFRIGTIQIDIYVVGLPSENILAGIKTKAVET